MHFNYAINYTVVTAIYLHQCPKKRAFRGALRPPNFPQFFDYILFQKYCTDKNIVKCVFFVENFLIFVFSVLYIHPPFFSKTRDGNLTISFIWKHRPSCHPTQNLKGFMKWRISWSDRAQNMDYDRFKKLFFKRVCSEMRKEALDVKLERPNTNESRNLVKEKYLKAESESSGHKWLIELWKKIRSLSFASIHY